jgi:hypothetical protein
MSQTVELPEKVWFALQEAAKASGVSPASWIASHLPNAANANGAGIHAEEEVADNQDPPPYTSVPLERVGSVQVVCVAGRELPPLPYPLEVPSE